MSRRILLVDDDAAVLLTLKAVLSLHHFDVETATSAPEACQKLEAGEFDLVITDVRMETEASGLEVIRAARQRARRPATAVLTAYPPRDERWKQEAVDAVLLKPMRTRDLVKQIESLLTPGKPTEDKNIR